MGELKHFDSGNSDIARKADDKPEGKVLNGFLLGLDQSEPWAVVAESRRQLLAELLTSILVVSATSQDRPVVGANTVSGASAFNTSASPAVLAAAISVFNRETAGNGNQETENDGDGSG